MTKHDIIKKDLLVTIGQNVKNLRESNNLTQEELARQLKLSRTTVHRIEKGEHGLEVTYLVDFMRIFGVGLYYLFGDLTNPYQLLDEKERDIVQRVLKRLEGGNYGQRINS